MNTAPQVLPGPSHSEPTHIPDPGVRYQYLIYNAEKDKFLCWNRTSREDDDGVTWRDTGQTSDRTLVIPTVYNIQEFELERANKENSMREIGKEVYDYLERTNGWDNTIFVPLLHMEKILDGSLVEGLLEKLDFVNGFSI